MWASRRRVSARLAVCWLLSVTIGACNHEIQPNLRFVLVEAEEGVEGDSPQVRRMQMRADFLVARKLFSEFGIKLIAEEIDDPVEDVCGLSCVEFIEEHESPLDVITAYYSPRPFRGSNCSHCAVDHRIIHIGTSSNPTTLAHELGHAFSLDEVSSDEVCPSTVSNRETPVEEWPNIMCQGMEGRRDFTPGQIWWQLKNYESAWNWLLSGTSRTCCGVAAWGVSGTTTGRCNPGVRCPPVLQHRAHEPSVDSTEGGAAQVRGMTGDLLVNKLVAYLCEGPTPGQVGQARKVLEADREYWQFDDELIEHYLGNWRRSFVSDKASAVVRFLRNRTESGLDESAVARIMKSLIEGTRGCVSAEVWRAVLANPELE